MQVSVITTLYNYRRYVKDCIESFLAQDLTDSELIIVDDASQDNPYKIIKPYESDRVRYIRLEQNKGYSHAKNVAIKASRSELLVMLDADDMLTVPSSLSVRYNEIQKGFDFVHGPAKVMLDGKERNGKNKFNKWLTSSKDHTCYPLVHAQGVMLRKQIHRDIGLYDETLKCKSDQEMWARIFNKPYRIGWVLEPVAIYRRHPHQMHVSKFKKENNKALQVDVDQKIERRKTDLFGLELLK